MRDLKSPRLMYLKAALFLMCGTFACTIILLDHPSWKVAGLLALAVWAFARAYYFAFHVIQHYIDPAHKFAGLFATFRYLWSKRKENR